MKKMLIAALVVALLLLAAAVGVVVYMETGTRANSAETGDPTDPADTLVQTENIPEETTEAAGQETLGISLPTEDPDEVGPEYTWPEDETGTAETAAPGDPDATWDPDENETPTMGV